jgi:hypothetical protein
MREIQIVIDALNETADHLSRLPWSTGPEEALRQVAQNIQKKMEKMEKIDA